MMNIFKNEEDTISFSEGETIFNEGDPGDVMFAVKSGSVDIFFGERLLETITEGGIFGEMALVDHEPRSAKAVARTDVELVRIDENRFNGIVQYNSFFALNVLRVAVKRLRRETSRD
jgi:CRP-like cAMP-binding protein